MKNMQNPTPDDILAVIDSVGRLQAENSLNWTPQPFKAMLAPATRCALLLSLGFILFWLLISSCASQSPILQPVLVTFYKNGMPLDIRGQADSMIFHGHKFDFVAYPDSDVVNGREKLK